MWHAVKKTIRGFNHFVKFYISNNWRFNTGSNWLKKSWARLVPKCKNVTSRGPSAPTRPLFFDTANMRILHFDTSSFSPTHLDDCRTRPVSYMDVSKCKVSLMSNFKKWLKPLCVHLHHIQSLLDTHFCDCLGNRSDQYSNTFAPLTDPTVIESPCRSFYNIHNYPFFRL
jgi:hypothetical protein